MWWSGFEEGAIMNYRSDGVSQELGWGFRIDEAG